MLNKLFSITEYNDTHNIAKVLGVKIKFPKRDVVRIRKTLPYDKYKSKNIDITKLPPAKGQLRKIQLANLQLLKELDNVCKQNNLTYWIDFGTLLGAIRHKGFIPWDDDVDAGMPRKDYEKIIDAFQTNSANPDIFADYVRCPNNPCQTIIKVQHKKCPHLFVDIFPYDNYSQHLNSEEQLEKTSQIKNLRKLMEKECTYEDNLELVHDLVIRYTKELVGLASETKKTDYFWGLDFNHHWKNWFSSYETIFPLKRIQFENIYFPCINNIEEYLHKVYGNYMEYPRKIGYGHTMFAKLSAEELKVIEELINNKE